MPISCLTPVPSPPPPRPEISEKSSPIRWYGCFNMYTHSAHNSLTLTGHSIKRQVRPLIWLFVYILGSYSLTHTYRTPIVSEPVMWLFFFIKHGSHSLTHTDTGRRLRQVEPLIYLWYSCFYTQSALIQLQNTGRCECTSDMAISQAHSRWPVIVKWITSPVYMYKNSHIRGSSTCRSTSSVFLCA